MIRAYGIGATLATLAVALLSRSVGAAPSDEIGHGFAPVGGTRLFYQVKGSGPAVVLIHGGQLDCRMWDDQVPALARNCKVIRYDVRGYGGSPRPDILYSNVDDLAGLLDYLKITKAHIIGLSLGGRIAIDFALAHPARVSSLVLAGPGLSGYEAPNSGESDLRIWNIIKADRDEGPDKATALWLKDPFMAPAMEQVRLAPRLQKIARENAHCWLENPVLERASRPAAVNRLGEIKSPTLLILGDRDVPQMKATIEQLEKGISHARKAVIKNAGHMVNMEQPESFIDLVLDFLHKQQQ
jgi:pimeloyl-ACP methyl ester carboxylesterase